MLCFGQAQGVFDGNVALSRCLDAIRDNSKRVKPEKSKPVQIIKKEGERKRGEGRRGEGRGGGGYRDFAYPENKTQYHVIVESHRT